MRDKLAIFRNYLTGPERRITILYALSAIFIGFNCYLIYRDIYWLLFLPVFLLILYLYFYHLDWILLLTVAVTPIAINITQFEFNVGVSVPSEPLMLGVLLLFVIRLFHGNPLEPAIWKHPMTLVIGLQLAWMLITSITSDMPLVSFKHLLARLWFVVPFYLIGIRFFSQRRNIPRFAWFYVVPFLGVVGYTIYHHSLWGFDEEAGHWVMEPFYNDHTIYGAIIALFIPIFIGFTFSRAYSRTTRFFAFLIVAVLLVALVLSYSRAAWLSLGFVTGILIIIWLKIKLRWLVLAAGVLGLLFYLFSFQILDRLEKNEQGPSANFVEHLRSISNISTDNSNLERINRWQSALRMFAERPVVGFGPGTYQFEYAPFQRAQEKTLISTNAGDKGNAHSEYIGPLAEQGLPGMVLMVAVVIMMLVTAMRVYKHADVPEVKMLSLVIMLSLLTYFLHGTMNNFLDSDKASVPVWGFIAALVALDLGMKKKKPAESPDQEIR